MGYARVEFHSGDRPLGRPVAERDGHAFRLPLGDTRPDRDARLRVTAGGKRLDIAAPDPSARLRPPRSGDPAPVRRVGGPAPGEPGRPRGARPVPHRQRRVRPAVRVAARLPVPVEVRGNTRFGYDTARDAFVKAVRGIVVGSHRGGVTARNDDPLPSATVTPVADDVAEGEALTWRATPSAAADADLMGTVTVLPVTCGAEPSTADADPEWPRQQIGEVPDPAVPLSEAVPGGLPLWFPVPAGETTAELTVPVVTDGLKEPTEFLRATLSLFDGSWEPVPGPESTGRRRDAA